MRLGKPTEIIPKDTYRKEYVEHLLDFIKSPDRIRALVIEGKQPASTYEILGDLYAKDNKSDAPRFAGTWRMMRNGVIYLVKEHTLWAEHQQ